MNKSVIVIVLACIGFSYVFQSGRHRPLNLPSVIKISRPGSSTLDHGGRGTPAVACWTSDHWVAGSNPLRGMFHH